MKNLMENQVLNTGENHPQSLAQTIRQLGGRPYENRLFRGVFAWIASLGAHAIVAVVVIAAAATAVGFSRKPIAPPTLVLDFQRPTYAPTVQLVGGPEASGAKDFRQSANLPAATDASDASVTRSHTLQSAAEQALIAVRQVQAPMSLAAHEFGQLSGVNKSVTINFAGLKASNARRVVYLVDASGSLVGTFPLIIEELRKSLQRLDPRQSFGVIFSSAARQSRFLQGATCNPPLPSA